MIYFSNAFVVLCLLSCVVMSNSATPWTVACQAPLSMGLFFQQEYWSRLPCPASGDLPIQGLIYISVSPALANRFFFFFFLTTVSPGRPSVPLKGSRICYSKIQLQKFRACNPKICHFGILIILSCRYLKNSKCWKRFSLNSHFCLKTDPPKET